MNNRVKIYVISAILLLCLVFTGCNSLSGYLDSTVKDNTTDLSTQVLGGTKYYGSLENVINDYASEYIITRHKPMAGTFYAYTEGVTDDLAGINGGEGNEAVFWPGSQLIKLKLSYDLDGNLQREEEILIDSPNGVVRDPDVSADGKTVVFSWKQSKQDDYHLYTYDLESGYIEQLTFGQGISDTEPKWLANGQIVFSSSRAIQIVDCWKTPVSNLYVCNADGSNIIRVGYDQVHTTYPTVADDGRVLYTRWDYNDRTQMFVQALFSMNADGTGQTAVFGNNSNNPTTLMHTVAIPGSTSKYLSIVSGHHVVQGGKLAIVDTAIDRDGQAPLDYVFEAAESGESIDTLGQIGRIYKFPIAINENEMFFARAESWASAKQETKFNLYYYNSQTNELVCVAESNGASISCSQIVPVRTKRTAARPSMVNYAKTTGTYYVANVYEGDTMKDVEFGSIKYLRVVALDYRPYAVGAVSAGNSSAYPDGFGTSDPSTPVGTANSTWDVKQVIGIVPVEEDGSVMFECPSDVAVYFQLLDENGLLIQSMRSWSTLMPGETFSCVGCHESKNNVPNGAGNVTMAMKKGVQKLQKDLWMTTPEYDDYDPYTDYKGFSYADEIQPILDRSCISCHNNVQVANDRLGSQGISVDLGNAVTSSKWKYLVTNKSEAIDWTSASFDPDWSEAAQPFGSDSGSSITWGSSDDACFYMTQQFELTAEQLSGKFYIQWQYDEDPELYLNGTRIDSVKAGGTYITGVTYFELTDAQKKLLVEGTNTLTARAYNAMGGSYMYVQLMCNTKEDVTTQSPVALTSEIRVASRDKVDYYLSYLVLTGSFLKGNYYCGTPTNSITDWIGGMSDPTTIPAYAHGSTQSGIITKLLGDHQGLLSSGAISMEDIYRIAAWIDLGVPFRGSYNEASENWGSVEMGEAERRQNMRDYYDKMDELNKANIAGLLSNKKVLIEYFDKNGNYVGAVESKHLATLYLEQKIQAGDTIVVTLPKGYEYIWFNLNPKMPISLQYCPDGVFTYTVPEYAENILPNLTVGNGTYVYNHPTITAFLPSEEDITGIYNVALNPYDAGYKDPDAKITAGSTWEDNGYGNFFPENAFDGFTCNRGHGSFPDQSWGPDKNASMADKWLKIDFGREVELYYFDLYIRADFPHDAYITELEIELSDGTTIRWSDLKETNQCQTLVLEEAVRTSSLKIKVISTSTNEWIGISEFKAFGRNVID